MQILEAITGPFENAVVYLDSSGVKRVVTRPSFFTVADIIRDIKKEESLKPDSPQPKRRSGRPPKKTSAKK